MYKKSTLSAFCFLTLTACGGSSSSEDVSEKPSQTPTMKAITLKVIDGYLDKAKVCVIPTGETDCKAVGETDEHGEITLPDNFASGVVLATIIAGQTKDQDRVGFVGNSYQLAAEISENSEHVVTPFTTLDYLDSNKSMADIAAELGLEENLIANDYVVQDSNEAAQAHAIARGLTRKLSVALENNNVSDLSAYSVKLAEYINTDLVNAAVDLDKVNVVVINGQVTHFKAITSLEDYLNGDLYMFSTNFDAYSREEIRIVNFSQGQASINGGSPHSYSIDGDVVNFGGERDQFIYVSHNLALQVPIADKDLIVTSPQNFLESHNWSDVDFVGKTVYFLNDDSFCDRSYCSESDLEPDPTLNEITFSEEEATMVDNGESIMFPWRIENGNLVLKLTAIGNERDIEFSPSVTDGNITVAKDIGYGRAPSLIFTDKSLAQSVHHSWLKM
ncbi:hypothetical protein [Thalassotalea ganghwensis]